MVPKGRLGKLVALNVTLPPPAGVTPPCALQVGDELDMDWVLVMVILNEDPAQPDDGEIDRCENEQVANKMAIMRGNNFLMRNIYRA